MTSTLKNYQDYKKQTKSGKLSQLRTLWDMASCYNGDFPGGPVVKNLPSHAGDMGSVPGWGAKISQAMEQLSLSTTTNPMHLSERSCRLQQRSYLLQLRTDTATNK